MYQFNYPSTQWLSNYSMRVHLTFGWFFPFFYSLFNFTFQRNPAPALFISRIGEKMFPDPSINNSALPFTRLVQVPSIEITKSVISNTSIAQAATCPRKQRVRGETRICHRHTHTRARLDIPRFNTQRFNPVCALFYFSTIVGSYSAIKQRQG